MSAHRPDRPRPDQDEPDHHDREHDDRDYDDREQADREQADEPRSGRRRADTAAAKAPASVSAGLGTRVRVHVGGRPGEYAIAVLDTVARIPPGKVMTYGDVAEYVGGGTGRHVGAVLARFGYQEDVPWHRVIRSTGEPNPTAPVEAIELLVADGTPLRPGGERVNLPAARWDGVTAADHAEA